MATPASPTAAPATTATKFLAIAVLTLALLGGLSGLYTTTRLGTAPAIGSRWIQELMTLKMRAASALSGRRLLVIGGSSALFGVLAEILSAETGMPAANLALHNNISPDYLFHWAKTNARRGDTLLLALEYNYYSYQGIPNMQTVDYVLTLDPDYFRQLPWSDKCIYASALSMDRVNSALQSLLPNPAGDPALENPIPHGQTAYQPYSFNQYGDQSWNQIPSHTRHLENFYAQDFSSVRLPSVGTKAVTDLATWCREHGVRLVATYPPFMRFPLHDHPRQRLFFQTIGAFYAKLGIPVLGQPDDFRYPREWFFDTDYHLHLPAARIHSQTLGRLLRQLDAAAPD